jgi:hypothetical protein
MNDNLSDTATGTNKGTDNSFRAELKAWRQNERDAFERSRKAFAAVEAQLRPRGSGHPSAACLAELDRAIAEWKDARQQAARLAGRMTLDDISLPVGYPQR